MTDSKYFTTTKKGEIFELKAELNSDKKEKKKEAVKKVIASMTVGKDVSALFPDVVNCMQTDNLELKKLVYLYLMNYAKSQPDMAIMAVNTFVKDCEDPNPLIRALAVRTMGCIRVDKITEYLCEPLRKCLKDEDPYVRKTAAVCVAKLHDINAQLVEDQGFLDTLKDLISDSNPMVVANAVAALSEIAESHPNSNLLDLNPQTINKLLTALNECTEWGQIFILDCLANYSPKDDREAQSICERVTPRLSHANSAVVLSAVKVLMKFMEMLSKDLDYYGTLLKKLAPPLVTLLSAEPELQYVALRNINLIVQKRYIVLCDYSFCRKGVFLNESTESPDIAPSAASQPTEQQPAVIPSQGDLLGDLLNLDLGPPVNVPPIPSSTVQMGAMDLLGGGLDSLMGDETEGLGGDLSGSPAIGAGYGTPAVMPTSLNAPLGGGLNDLFDLAGGIGMPSGSYVAPKTVWLPAAKAKGLEISGTFSRRMGHIYMDLSLMNKAMQVMTDFAIQFNRNSFGMAPAAPLQVNAPLAPNQTIEASLPLNTVGPVMKMDPLTNLQVAVKNNIDVFYFSCLYPINMLFVEDGKMDRQIFLATWKDIPNENEVQFQIKDCHLNADAVTNKLQSNNIFTVAKRNVEGQDMLYQSLKLTNGIWVLAELRIQPGNPNYTDLELSLKCRAPEVSQHVFQAYEIILKN
ncbi:AP-1 complex subunit beta-1 [Heterodontus francisci]|uniref:AP-1 complex subunit beta-1 n=1 Tax=Heterodontus francisci TaxID=7792 RepID=UPI00355C3BD2